MLSRLLAEPHATLCGADPAAHCGWCYAAAGFAALGLAAFATAASAGRFAPSHA